MAWPATFSHLVGYGSCYYSYVYAHCATSALWERVLEHEPLARPRLPVPRAQPPSLGNQVPR